MGAARYEAVVSSANSWAVAWTARGLLARYVAVCGVLGAKTAIRFYDDISEPVAEIAKRDSPPLFFSSSVNVAPSMVLFGGVIETGKGAERLVFDDLQKAQRLDIGAVSFARVRLQSRAAGIAEGVHELVPEGGCVCGAPPQTIPLRHLVIGELETALDGPMAFSSGEPVAYATGPPTIGQGVWRRIGRRQPLAGVSTLQDSAYRPGRCISQDGREFQPSAVNSDRREFRVSSQAQCRADREAGRACVSGKVGAMASQIFPLAPRHPQGRLRRGGDYTLP